MKTKPNLGWIGVGKMGTPMSTNLLKAGYKLTVFDIAPAAMKALVDQGATSAESPLEVTDQADLEKESTDRAAKNAAKKKQRQAREFGDAVRTIDHRLGANT